VQACSGGSDNLTADLAARCAPLLNHLVISFHGPKVVSRATYQRQVRLLELARDIFLPANVGVTITMTVTRKHAGQIDALTSFIAETLGRRKVLYSKGESLYLRYDPEEFGTHAAPAFQNFVQPCIQGGMRKHLADLGWTTEDGQSLFSEQDRRLLSAHRCSRQPERILAYAELVNGRPCGLEPEGESGAAGYNRMTIRWDGEVVPCASSYRFTYGNVLERGAAELWRNSYQTMRMPEVVNAYTIWLAFGSCGTCCYGQDAAYTGEIAESAITEACLAQVLVWQQERKHAGLGVPSAQKTYSRCD
jgi:MoaA/NifB/PqqE/SkfB family radical SAM enzyme